MHVIIIQIVVSTIFGLIGKSIGKKRTIGPVAGFLLCFFLGVIGVIIVLCCKVEKQQPESDKSNDTCYVKSEPQHVVNKQPEAVSELEEAQKVEYEPSFREKPELPEDPEYDSPFVKGKEDVSQTDGSILGGSKSGGDAYLDQLAIEVCLNGENLSKFERIVTKQYGGEVYENLQRFVEEVSRSTQRRYFTKTSIANLSYLGRNLGLSDVTVNKIVKHYANTNS